MRQDNPDRCGIYALIRALALLCALACPATVFASPPSPEPSVKSARPDPSIKPGVDLPSYRLWDGKAPGARADTDAERPFLTLYRPPDAWSNRTAIIIAPGGGYIALSHSLEGAEPANWFASRGVTAFVLTYRVEPTMLPNPLLDGARAVRFVRAHAAQFGVDPDRIGLMGFSAGGHLAAMTAARSGPGDPAAKDPVERVSDRPDFLVLGYPWLEATVRGPDGQSPYCLFARTFAKLSCDDARYTGYLPVADVKPGAPPTFIYHTTDDTVVPVAGSVRYYLALRDAGVPAELHVFEKGQHGSGMGGSNLSLSRWPLLLQEWMRRHDLLPPPGVEAAYP